MKRLALFGIFMCVMACTATAPPQPDEPVAPPTAPGAFETAEAAVVGGGVERMHADGNDWVALLAHGDGHYELVRLTKQSGVWVIVDRTPSNEDYLWPEQ